MYRSLSAVSRVVLGLGAVVAVAGGGCAHRQPLPVPTTPQVRRVLVEPSAGRGLEMGARRVAEALGTRPTPWWAYGVGFHRFWVPLDRDRVTQDRRRLERFYEAHGFFDAHCISYFIDYRGREVAGGRRWAIVTFTVEEGPRSLVRDVSIRGGDQLPPDLLQALSRALSMTSGDPFTVPDHRADRQALQRTLQDWGYAYAVVERRADAYPDDRAVDLTYTAHPGLHCRFGAITIEGLQRVPERRVWREIRVRPGHEYSLSRLHGLQKDVFGMGVFSVVTVTPDLSDATREEVPVTVSVRESRPVSIKVGAGLGLERGRDDLHGSFSLTHRNLFGRLVQLDLSNRVGWAWVPDLVAPESSGPIVLGQAELVEPGVPIRALTLRQRAAFDVDVESGYKFLSPSAAVGVDWRIHRLLTAGISYNIEFFDLYWRSENLELSAADQDIPEVDTDGLYTLSYLQQDLVLDARDDPLLTSRGLFARAAVAEAGGFLGGGFDYLKLSGEIKAYVDPVPRRLVLALRAQAGWIRPSGDTTSAPLSQRFKAGGSTSVRGWGRDQLGPRIYPESCDDGSSCSGETTSCARRDCQPIATGGHLMLVGGAEVRAFPVDLGRMPLGFAVFLDVGRVWEGPAEFSWDGLMFSAGGGVRLRAPFGVVRLDAAGRLNDDPTWTCDEAGGRCDPRFLVHFGLSEAF